MQDVEHITHALGWKHFALLGHSMGAVISVMYAGTFPEKVTKLCLLDGVVPLQDTEDKARDNLRSSILTHATVSAKKNRFEVSMEAAEARLLGSNPGLTPASAKLLLRRGATACDGGFRFTRDLRLRLPSKYRLTEEMVNSFVRHVACDVMLVVADSSMNNEMMGERERREVELLQRSAKSFEVV